MKEVEKEMASTTLGIRVMIVGICAITLLILWVIGSNLYDKSHIVKGISLP